MRFITPFFMVCTGMYLPPIFRYGIAIYMFSIYPLIILFETSLQEVILYILRFGVSYMERFMRLYDTVY